MAMFTCLIVYRADCCDLNHVHDRVVEAPDARTAGTEAWLALKRDIPSAEIASDEIVIAKGTPELLGVPAFDLPSGGES